MNKCIFCGKSEQEFVNNSWSIEHIIPKVLGNKDLTINCVCKDCNSKMGEYIDNYFVNNLISKMKRQDLGLKGESGKITNAFSRGKDEEGNSIKVEKVGNKFYASIVPKVEETENKIRIITSSKEKTKEIFQTKAKRMSLNNEQIENGQNQIDMSEEQTGPFIVTYDVSIDLKRYFLEALKIAYEFAVYELGENYLMDVRAEEIQKYLKKAIDGDMNKSCPEFLGVSLMPGDIFKSISNIIPEDSYKNYFHDKAHLLILIPDQNNVLLALIFLFMDPLYSFVVKLSEHANDYINPPRAIYKRIEINNK